MTVAGSAGLARVPPDQRGQSQAERSLIMSQAPALESSSWSPASNRPAESSSVLESGAMVARCSILVAAVTTLALAAGRLSAAVAPPDSVAASSSDAKHQSWLAAAAVADSGVVWRLEPTPGDSSQGPALRWNRVASRSVVSGDW